MAVLRPVRRVAALSAAFLLGMALIVVGSGSASAASDPYNTSVTVNPLRAACERNAPTCNSVGTTNGYFNGKDVKLLYSQNYFCDLSVAPASNASAKDGCEAGAQYNKLPPGTAAGAIDPLYIPIPLFSNPGYVLRARECRGRVRPVPTRRDGR